MPEYCDLLTRHEPMAIELGNQALLGALYSRMGNCDFGFGHFDQGIKTLTKAAELCESAGNAEDAGFAYQLLGWNYQYSGDYDRVLALKENLLHTMERRFNLRWYVMGLCVASRACLCLGRWGQAVEEAQNALKVAEEFSDNSLIALMVLTLSMAHTWKGDLARGVEYGELAYQKAPTPGDKAFAQRALGWALCRTGGTSRGIELMSAALKTFRDGNWMPGIIPTMCTLGGAHWFAGEDDKARKTLQDALQIANRCGARYYVGWSDRFLGEIELKSKPDQSATHFERSIAILLEIKAENELALAYAGYGRLHKQQGQIAKAREYLMKALEIFERLGTLIEPEKVRDELNELSED